MSFVVTDFQQDVRVVYSGVVPDLFRENQGVVAHGRLGADGVFVADEILAKHDENYMPPEVARAIKEKHGGVMPVNPDVRSVPRT
jgi:cytochrome c-type biogenesis protein CcmE